MKKQLIYLLGITLAASCSEGDIQLNIEKTDKINVIPSESKNISQSQKNAYILANLKKQQASSKPKASINNNTQINNSSAHSSPNTNLQPKLTPTQITTNKTEKQSNIDNENADLMNQLSESLEKIDDSKAFNHYSEQSSGVAINLGGSLLTHRTVDLGISKRQLDSNVSAIGGAISIQGDPNGFGFTIGLSGDYLFEFDKDTLVPKAENALKRVLALYNQYEGTEIAIEGHTDSKGSDEYNLTLSNRRANSVKTWFIGNDIKGESISTKGYGETQPIASNTRNGSDHPEGRALNRRVNITIKTTKKVNHLPTISK